jgi:hypothetical protein
MASDGHGAVGPAKLVGARVKRVEDPRFLTGMPLSPERVFRLTQPAG